MKVIIDTSVLVSSFISKSGESREILRLVFKEKLKPQINNPLFLEYEDVLNRNKIMSVSPLNNIERAELFSAFLSQCNWVDIFYLWRPNLRDENDNYLIELAVASNTSLIVTYNTKDFLNSELDFEIEVFTPNQFLKEKLWEQ
jgi:putative PIN family toxin of toxin-antitoxin system